MSVISSFIFTVSGFQLIAIISCAWVLGFVTPGASAAPLAVQEETLVTMQEVLPKMQLAGGWVGAIFIGERWPWGWREA